MTPARRISRIAALSALVCMTALAFACSSDDATATPALTPSPTPTETPVPPTPLPDDVLIENTRKFLSNSIHTFDVEVDAEGDGRISHNCLEALEGGPGGFEWSVEQGENGLWLVRIDHTASLIEPKTGTWLVIPGGGVGTTSDSITCDELPADAYYRDNPRP